MPSFGHYATLGVDDSATTEQITIAYRRLALVYHPDKNPDAPEAATDVFQKIQLAYETLRDTRKRFSYDASAFVSRFTSSTPQDQSTSSNGSNESSDDGNIGYDDDHFRRWYQSFCMRFLLFSIRYQRDGSSFSRDRRQPTYEGQRSFGHESEESEEEKRARGRAAEEYIVDVARRREQARVWRAQAAAKQTGEDLEAVKKELDAMEKEADRIAEKSRQETRWTTMNAQTKEEKVKTCLHSQFCAKTQHRQKFKCGACHVKRGITAFECPHCAIFICQKCLVDFTKKRIAAKKNPIPKPEPVIDPKPEPKVSDHDKKSTSTNSKGGRGHPHKDNARPRCYRPRCYNCNELGHIARHCRNRTAGQPNGSAGTETK
ncbi:DnaJ-domain-containing protein [Hypoxylon sp. NC0597]|nr:DnaJ-domain-containing protein [Hypoxylon sp. NC0597]